MEYEYVTREQVGDDDMVMDFSQGSVANTEGITLAAEGDGVNEPFGDIESPWIEMFVGTNPRNGRNSSFILQSAWVLLHELGHTAGLRHIDVDPNAGSYMRSLFARGRARTNLMVSGPNSQVWSSTAASDITLNLAQLYTVYQNILSVGVEDPTVQVRALTPNPDADNAASQTDTTIENPRFWIENYRRRTVDTPLY